MEEHCRSCPCPHPTDGVPLEAIVPDLNSRDGLGRNEIMCGHTSRPGAPAGPSGFGRRNRKPDIWAAAASAILPDGDE